jgi:tripartite-type tricarboxylate transporter receptor subunit TctC
MRLAGLQGVPTLAEVGVTGVDVAQWYGLFAPAGTPEEVIAKLNRLLNEVLTDPAVVERFQSHGAQVEPGTPDALSTKVKAELARWSRVVKQARLAPHESRLATLD